MKPVEFTLKVLLALAKIAKLLILGFIREVTDFNDAEVYPLPFTKDLHDKQARRSRW